MTCAHCTADTADGLELCKRCCKTAEHALVNIAAYYADLDRVPLATGFRRRSNTAPDPTGLEAAAIFTDPVSEADAETTTALTTWARRLASSPPVGVRALTEWFERNLNTIATEAWASEWLRDLLRLERLLRKVITSAGTGQYLGACGHEVEPARPHDADSCGCACHRGPEGCDVPGGCSPEQPVIGAVACQRVLYAQAEDRWVNCRDCGSTWDVRGRRELLMRRAEDELAPVAVIAQLAATITGETSVGKIEARIRKWVERNRIKAVTTKVIEGRERRVYRVGDVLDLLADTPTTNNTNRSA